MAPPGNTRELHHLYYVMADGVLASALAHRPTKSTLPHRPSTRACVHLARLQSNQTLNCTRTAHGLHTAHAHVLCPDNITYVQTPTNA